MSTVPDLAYYCLDCKAARERYVKLCRTPLRLSHLAVIACMKLLHPFEAINIDSLWFLNFKVSVLNTKTKNHFISIKRKKRRHYTMCKTILERIIDLIKFKEPAQKCELVYLLDRTVAFCCCNAFVPCLNYRIQYCSSNNQYFRNAYKFDQFNAHVKEDTGCCCDGYFRPECTRYEYVYTSLLFGQFGI